MNKFTCVLLLGTALLAGCVDREGGNGANLLI